MSLKVWLPLTGDLNNYGTQNLPNTSVNSFTYGAGKIGQCASGRVAWILPAEILDNTWSVAMWVRPESLGSNNNILFCKNGTAATDCQIYFSIISTTQLNIGVNGPSSSVTATGQTFTLNKWYHVAATYDGQTASVYLNGQLLKSGTVTTEKPTGRLNMNINGRCTNASNTGSTGHFTGAFNDFRLYDHCLSLSEVREISQGLILHYKFDKISTEIINAYTTPYFNSNAASGGWSHWGSSGKHDGSFAINTDKQYMFFKDKERNHKVSNGPTATATYLTYQSPAFEGGYRSLQCIVKESEGREITEDILVPAWNARSGGAPSATWTRIIPLGDGFYLCQVDGIQQSGSDDLIGFNLKPGYTVYFSAAWCENDKEVCSEVLFPYNEIEDSSGYNHNGEAIGNLELINSEGRYRTAIYFNCSEPNTNNDNGITYIETPLLLTEPTELTFAWWAKPESGYNGSVAHAAFCTSNSATRPTDYNTTAFHHRDSSFDICPVSGSAIRLPLAYTQNQWHHYAVTYDGKTARAYKDGEQTATVAFSANNALKTFSKLFIGYSQAGGVHRKTLGSYSDFRVYVTALLDNDIKKLYNTSMSVDRANQLYTFELEEIDDVKTLQQGILTGNIVEPFVTLDDGSHWQLLMYHYVDKGNNLFTQSTALDCNEFGLFSRLAYVNNFVYDGKYEFYVIQDDIEYRWTQTNQPTATSPSGFTAVSGYTNPVNGLVKASSNSYFGYNSWWGACGSWTKYSTGGKTGIPGFGAHNAAGICERYLALYARIDEPHGKISYDKFNQFTQFIER